MYCYFTDLNFCLKFVLDSWILSVRLWYNCQNLQVPPCSHNTRCHFRFNKVSMSLSWLFYSISWGFFDVLFILNNLDLDIISYSNSLSLDTSVNTSKPMRVMNWLFIYHRLTIKNHEEKSTTNLREFSLLLVYLQYKDWYMVSKYWLGVV